jgi:tripartite-type tricarboxylate transporter receptor subunit TctC
MMGTLRLRKLAVALICLVSCIAVAAAQPYPNKVVTIVVPVAPGGVSDTLARALALRLAQSLGQQVIVENRGGAAHTIGAAAVAKSTPDGYTLLLTEGTALIPSLYKSLPYDPEKDLAPVSGLITISQGVVTNPALPVNNVTELIALAKSKPQGLNYANFGAGGQLNMALLSTMTGAKFVGVPYRGSAPAMNDVIAGHVPMMVVSVGLAAPQARSGKVKLLAVTGARRVTQLPEVPTIAEGGWPTFEATFWFGLFAPGGTPPDILARINTEVQKILSDGEFRERSLNPYMFEPLSGSPVEFVSYIRDDVRKWDRVIRDANIKVD